MGYERLDISSIWFYLSVAGQNSRGVFMRDSLLELQNMLIRARGLSWTILREFWAEFWADEIRFYFYRWLFTGLAYTKTVIHIGDEFQRMFLLSWQSSAQAENKIKHSTELQNKTNRNRESLPNLAGLLL